MILYLSHGDAVKLEIFTEVFTPEKSWLILVYRNDNILDFK